MNKFCEIQGVSKSYGATKALKNVSLEIKKGEILGIIGENGAGKSTILKILAGIERSDEGRIFLNGNEIEPQNYNQATRLGITMVFQEQALVHNLKVYENLLLSHEDNFGKLGFLSRKKMLAYAQEILDFMDLDEIDPLKTIGEYDFSVRQMIEIAKAISIPRILGIDNPLVLFDEPTTALTHSEVQQLHEKMKLIKGLSTMVFVSHRLNEMKEFCDRIYVFKDGENIAEIGADADEDRIYELMVGRKRDKKFYKEDLQTDYKRENVVLEVKNLAKSNFFSGVNFQLHQGEILGIGGLKGCGKTEMVRCLAGISKLDVGSVLLQGKELAINSVQDAIRSGIGYVPAERQKEGIITNMCIPHNVTLAAIEKITGAGQVLNLTKEKEITRDYIDVLSIRTPATDSLLSSLSGGNQQKVLLAKWLLSDVGIMILDNPTRGVDVGAREEIYRLIRNLVAEGRVAVILVTDDLLELIGLSNRIMLMKNGEVICTRDSAPHDKPTEEELIKHIA